MTRFDRLALLLSIVTLAVVYWVTTRIYEGVPHIEDEVAYSWQASVMARGDLALDSPPCPQCFLTPFVVDYNGLRFGKYPPGWPAALSLGVRLDARDWVNPFLAALCVWLTYRLVKRLLDEKTALLASLLTVTSPFFLLNAGTLLSHIWSYFLVLAFILAWLELCDAGSKVPAWVTVSTAGLALGSLALTRPLTAVAVAVPFMVHGLTLLVRASGRVRRRILAAGALTALIAALLFVWQYAVTGDPTLNPYTLWWPYDRIGFAPGVGVQEGGHNLNWARINTRFSLRAGSSDLFGWGNISWLYLPLGVIAIRKKPLAWLVSLVSVSLVLLYGLYWIGSWVFGPRYYFEGLISATLLSSAGILWAAGKLKPPEEGCTRVWLSRIRLFLTASVTVLLMISNLLYYLPVRVGGMHGLYGATSAQMEPFKSPQAQELTPALIIVHRIQNWREYATLLEISSPYFDTPFVFSYNRGSELNQLVIDAFPDRSVWHYYADTPYRFYSAPRLDAEH